MDRDKESLSSGRRAIAAGISLAIDIPKTGVPSSSEAFDNLVTFWS